MSEKFSRWRRGVPVAVLTVITAAGLVCTAATAAADPLGPSGAAKGAPAAVPATRADAGCTLSPSLNLESEQASCIGVGATLSAVPALGKTATLTVTVKTGRVENATQVTVDLPASLAFADGTRATAAVTGAGRSSRATLAVADLAAGETRTWTRTVKAVGTGAGEIRAAAASTVAKGRVDAGADHLHLTVGRDAAASRAGIAQAAGDRATAAATGKVQDTRPNRAGQALPSVAVPAQRSAAAPGTTCATGSWVFTDQNGATVGAYQTAVQVWRGGGIVAAGYAAGNGAYNLCWSSGGGVNAVYVRFVESNNAWKVVTSANNDYAYVTGTQNLADGTTGNFGTLQPADSTQHRALHAYYDAAVMFDWIYQNAPGQNAGVGCWSPYAASCRQLVVHWQSDSTTGTFWNSSGVYLLAASPDSEDEPVHEYGHDLMYGLYGNTFPATTNCSPHYLLSISSTTCGWTEGFADWVPTSVWGNTVYTFPSGSTLDFNRTWGDGSDYGDQVEGRIVQALDSLNDGVKYPYDNLTGSGYRTATPVYTVLRNSRPATMAAYWSGRAANGQATGQPELSALYQGTIDYGFRNPLTDGQLRVFPAAIGPNNYSATTNTGYWSAVAIRPGGGGDSDLTLFGDAGQTQALASSAYGGEAIDFVAVNSNSGMRPFQTYYPRVTRFDSSSAGYYLQFQQGSSTFSAGSRVVTLTSGQVIANLDSYQNAGVPVYYRAVPAAGQSVGLTFLQPGQSVTGRSGGVNSPVGTAGAAVGMTATPSATGYGGLVLVNQGLSAGDVTLYADTTAPTGTIAIRNGAASSATLTVPLTLSSADAETGVTSMQISTDGTFDTEPVVPYATSATARLAGVNGVKTVYVRYLDNAGMWSAPIADTITLLVAPTATTVNPATGPAGGGTTVTVRGTRFTGATAVSFGARAATSFTVVNDTTIRAVAPAGTGTATIRVTVPAGTATTTGTFRYIPTPVITSITPTSGPVGTVVTVTGTNFTGATKVLFQTTPGTDLVLVNSTRLRITAPAKTGIVNIRVLTPGGSSAIVVADRFTYTG